MRPIEVIAPRAPSSTRSCPPRAPRAASSATACPTRYAAPSPRSCRTASSRPARAAPPSWRSAATTSNRRPSWTTEVHRRYLGRPRPRDGLEGVSNPPANLFEQSGRAARELTCRSRSQVPLRPRLGRRRRASRRTRVQARISPPRHARPDHSRGPPPSSALWPWRRRARRRVPQHDLGTGPRQCPAHAYGGARSRCAATVRYRSAGGGGFGSPLVREPAPVLEDADEKVRASAQRATLRRRGRPRPGGWTRLPPRRDGEQP